MVIITELILWISSGITFIKPFIPGVLVTTGWTFGTHIVSFTTSWFAAKRYLINCIGTGVGGFFNSYWKIGSVTCTTLLFSHVSLLGIAIGSLLMTILFFIWFFYKKFKYFTKPIIREIKNEIYPIKEQ